MKMFIFIFGLVFFIHSIDAYAFDTVCIEPWNNSVYTIEIHTSDFQNYFGKTPESMVSMVKCSIYSWWRLAPAIPKVEFYEEPHSNDAEVHGVNGCYNGDCNILGIASYTCWPTGSDNCDVYIYRGDPPKNWTDDGSSFYDLQSVLTHEFGHCLGLDDNPEDGESVMNYSENGYMNQRFTRRDDKEGVWYKQGVDNWPLYWRLSSAYSWSNIGNTRGSPAIATGSIDGYVWDLMAYLLTTEGAPSQIGYKARRRSDGLWQRNGDICKFYINGIYEYSYDGVSSSKDVNGFAIAFRAYDDSSHIRVIRNIVPTTSQYYCPTGYTYQFLTDSITYRKPSLAYDPSSNRLVLAYIEKGNFPRIKIRTSNSVNGNWTSEVTLNEWTDVPVGIDCYYWNGGPSKCFLAFPTVNDKHNIRLCRGYINSYGNFVLETCQTNPGHIYTTGTEIGVAVYSTSVKMIYTGMDNARYLNILTVDNNWNWSNEVLNARSPTGPGMSDYGAQIHAGFNE